MLVKYYNNEELAYANRARYRNINLFTPFAQEEQESVSLLGDGGHAELKTSKNNLCNYATIDNTRWFMVSFVYLNGGQVQINLQRDVIGEKGFSGMVGKVSRGWTDSVLKNRKELSLNQILKKRDKLTPNTLNYGNFKVSTHDNEMWGVLYFVKPDRKDGDTVNINIPSFNPNVAEEEEYPPINGYYYVSETSDTSQTIIIKFNASNGFSNDFIEYFAVTITYKPNLFQDSSRSYWILDEYSYLSLGKETRSFNFGVTVSFDGAVANSEIINNYIDIFETVLLNLVPKLANSSTQNEDGKITYLNLNNYPSLDKDYDGITIQRGDDFYSYVKGESEIISLNNAENQNYSMGAPYTNQSIYIPSLGLYESYTANVGGLVSYPISLGFTLEKTKYELVKLSPSESGQIVIDLTTQFVDEPYNILLFPLYDVVITGITNPSLLYTIQKDNAFMIFNEVINYLSGGSNPYLIDAQIYPYCPVLTKVQTSLKSSETEEYYPFFAINRTMFNTRTEVTLLPLLDVKKEYIQNSYSIVSPEQSSKVNFDFYDYVNARVEGDNPLLNYQKLGITIKTALKPFSIIASAVIQPEVNALAGITYYSSLIGCTPSANGFESSLSSNAFQTYKRENSNFQQIFALQQEELAKQHEVEKVNDIAGIVTSTIQNAALGAMAGHSVAGGGKLGIAGAIGGGVAAGAATGGLLGWQMSANEGLREFERDLQQKNFDLQVGTIKNLPNSINRISSFNEIIMNSFYFTVETYTCTNYERELVDSFIKQYSYSIGVIDDISKYFFNGWFLRAELYRSTLPTVLHNIANNELKGGIYLYE